MINLTLLQTTPAIVVAIMLMGFVDPRLSFWLPVSRIPGSKKSGAWENGYHNHQRNASRSPWASFGLHVQYV